jgi:D-lyxose ketol-isomerase
MLSARAQDSPHGYDFASNVMHVDTEAICPKCLTWITPDDIVRRTAYGLLQHEACTMSRPDLPAARHR